MTPNLPPVRTITRLLTVTCLMALIGCAGGVIRNPLPAQNYQQATVLGLVDVRYWGDAEVSRAMIDALKKNTDGSLQERYAGVYNREHHYLAISGGGAEGAYGAGLLNGWSELGTRPEFTMVTGVSTGALTAPFAFLGPAYDQQLKEVYTTLDSSRIFQLRNLFTVFRADSVVDVKPLIEVIDKYITDAMVAEIAVEYRRGRTLQIATTNLDAGRPVFWNIGRIADSGAAGAADLIRTVMRASASIPGVFPPVYIKVRGPDGREYDEMHVDGGTSAQMFLYPAQLDWGDVTEKLRVRGTPRAYLIRNSTVSTEYEPVSPRLVPIVARTVDSLIRNQGIGDAYRIYTLAARDGIDVELSWIPADAVSIESDEAFDPEYMSALFEFGYQRALRGDAWVDLAERIDTDD